MNKKFIFLLLFFISFVFVGCSAFQAKSYDQEKLESFSGSSQNQQKIYASDARAEYDYSQSVARKRKSSLKNSSLQANAQQKRILHYQANMKIEVGNFSSSLEKVRRIVKLQAGYLENQQISRKQGSCSLRLRVPQKNFETVISSLKKIGSVKNLKIHVNDVTSEFHDTTLRLQSKEKIRVRLLVLLNKCQKTEEKVKILKEIERLDSQIKFIKKQLAKIKKDADYSIIDLQLLTKNSGEFPVYQPSPFLWIAALQPVKRSIYNKKVYLDYEPLEGFFDCGREFYKKRKEYLLITPQENSFVRIGVVDNYPFADQKFWLKALSLEFANRGLKPFPFEKEISGFNSLHYQDVHLGQYQISFKVIDKKIIIVEFYTKNAENFSAQEDARKQFLQGVKLK